MQQVTWQSHSVLIGQLHDVRSDSDSQAVVAVIGVWHSVVAVDPHLRDKCLVYDRQTRNQTQSASVKEYLSIFLNADGVVVQSY